MAKSVSKSLKKTSKKLSNKAKRIASAANNTIRVNNATVKKVSINSITKPKGSSKKQIMSRRAIAQPNLAEDKLRDLVSNYAKTANKRLRNIEGEGLEDESAAYRSVRTFSRDGRTFMGKTKKGEFKFRTDVTKMDAETLRKEAMELDSFLFRSKTSTVKGIKDVLRQREALLKQIKEKAGQQNADGTKSQFVMDYFNNMSLKEFNEFWENQSMSAWVEQYGSDEVIRLIQEGEDKGLDLEKMVEIFTSVINGEAKTDSIMELRAAVRKDMTIRYAKSSNPEDTAADAQNIIDQLESTEPEIGVDEDGFMKLW